MTTQRRSALAATLRELADYGAAGSVFGQFVGQDAVSARLILAGIAIWVAFVSFALLLQGD